jgi:glycosyltransferase involved in cell wall biosynthesis
MNSHPKILFVHDFQPEARAVADLIRQMFLGYPAAQLHWWHCRRTALYDQPDLRAATVHSFCIPEKLVPHARLTEIKSRILENLWAPLAARHLERTIAETQPDLVVALLFGWSVPALQRVRWPAGQRRHFSLWDFPDTNGMKKILGAARSRRFTQAVFQLVQAASSFDGICPAVLGEIKIQTGRADGLVIHSGFEPHHLQALENAPIEPARDDVIRLAYVGTIISDDGFLKMLSALNQIRPALPQKVVLEFFGGRNYSQRAWFDAAWMVEHPMFTDDGLIATLRRCDWGLVVMDPEGADLQYSRFSFPNKVGTCLSAGLPVLGYGNPGSSLGQLMQAQPVGRFTSATDDSGLEKFLVDCLSSPAPRQFFRPAILHSAQTEFNAAAMRSRLWQKWGATV